MRKFLVMFAITFLASWQTMLAANGHFITDAAYRTKVETAFKQKVNLVGKQFYDQKMPSSRKLQPMSREPCSSSTPTCLWSCNRLSYELLPGECAHQLRGTPADGLGKQGA